MALIVLHTTSSSGISPSSLDSPLVATLSSVSSPSPDKLPTAEQVRETFVSKSAELFWHFVAREYRTANLFKDEIIDQRIKTIQGRIGKNSFQRRDPKWGMTPLHVAAILGNRVAIQFFLLQYSDTEIKDHFQQKPIDYARKYHSDLLDLFPDVQMSQIVEIFKQFYQESKWIQKLPALTQPYQQHTQDFGREVKKLLIGYPLDGDNPANQANQRIIQDLLRVATHLGIQARLAKSDNLVFPRDLWLKSAQGKMVEPLFYHDSLNDPAEIETFAKFKHMKPKENGHARETMTRILDWSRCPTEKNIALANLLLAIEKSSTKTHLEAINAVVQHDSAFGLCRSELTKCPALEGYSTVTSLKRHFGDSIFNPDVFTFELGVDEIRQKGLFHFDGGNVFLLTNPQGETQALVGRSHYLGNYMLSRTHTTMFDPLVETLAKRSGLSKEEWLRQQKIKISGGASFEALKEALYDLVGLDVIKLNKEIISTRQSELRPLQYKALPSMDAYMNMSTAGMFMPNGNKVTKEDLIDYIWQTKLCKQASAASLGLKKASSLHYVTQGHYHLDLFIRPGPNHTIFLQDYQLCFELLQHLKKYAKELKLTKKDLDLLDACMQTAQQLQKELTPVFSKIRKEIENAGFTILPMPGYFVFPEFNMNFMNALSGWSEEQNAYYYVVFGCAEGDRLGQALMASFQAFLQQYNPDIKTYFVGRNPTDLKDFSEVLSWGSTEEQAGVHCFTLELETKSH